MLGSPNAHVKAPKHMSIESVMPSNHLILCRLLLLPPSIFPSIRVFSNESILCIRWPKHWSYSFSISPSNEHSGLISLRIDWLDLLAAQGTLKSLLQHHSSKAELNMPANLENSAVATGLKRSGFIDAFELVLEKTLENPLDCKEIQPVHP